MKTLKPGVIPVPWWPYKIKNVCRRCGCEWMLESGDIFTTQDPVGQGSIAYVDSNCPTCNTACRTWEGK